MFGKKKEDIYAVAKAAAEIAVRRVIANNPKVAVPMKLICALVVAGEMDDLLKMIADNNPKLFSKDPLLMADIKTILALIGFMDVTIDRPKLEAITGHVCKMI